MKLSIKLGDFVQYRSAMGELMGYGIVIRKTEYWTTLLDQETGKEVLWSDDLMMRIVK